MTNLRCTMIWLVFLLAHLNLELVQCLAYVERTCSFKSWGYCPSSQNFNRCNSDQDCFWGRKCCDDCGRRCEEPAFPVTKVTTVEQIFTKLKTLTKLVAKCPTSPPSSSVPPGPEQECQNDASCDGKYPGQDLKCCKDGDDFRCMSPVVESVNQTLVRRPCPPRPGTLFLRIVCVNLPDFTRTCSRDEDCQQRYPALKSYVRCCLGCRGTKCIVSIY